MPPRTGGSFAPPITADRLHHYRVIAASAPDPVKEAIGKLIGLVELFWQTPASSLSGKPHQSGKGTIVPLEEVEVRRIWDAVPWPYECDAYQRLFDALEQGPKGSAQAMLRDAAFHLLWFAKELTQDREPMTTDKL